MNGTRLACVAIGLLAAACTRQPPSMGARLQQHRPTFEQLRDLILAETPCTEVWRDHYEWTEACNAGPCKGAPPPPATGRPPGVAPSRCDWPGGCGRWEDRPPTPKILASICRMPLARASTYLDGLGRTGALRLRRSDVDGVQVTFDMLYEGIIPSGSETSIVWRATPPPALHSGTAAKGSSYAPLSPGWWVYREWN